MATTSRAAQNPASEPPEDGRLDDATLLWGYRQAVFSRAMTLKCVNLTQSGQAKFWIGGPGEEIHGTASALALEHAQPDPSLRALHGHYRSDNFVLAMGSLKGWSGEDDLAWKMIRQQLTRASDDMSLGRQMVNHWVVPELGVQPIGTPVGMQLGRAVGYARAWQLKGEDGGISIGIVGDGSSAEGDMHDAMNAGSVWRPPAVVMVTDNSVAIATTPQRGRGIKDFRKYAESFGFAFFEIDGFDFEACYRQSLECFQHVVAGKGPAFVHARVPRLMGHSSAGDMAFRYELEDPVLTFGRKLVERGLLDENEILRRLDDAANKGAFHRNHAIGRVMEEADERINAIAKVVVAEPYPDGDSIWEHVRRPFPEGSPEPAMEGTTIVPYGLAIRTALDRNLATGRAAIWGEDVGALGGVMSCTRGLSDRHGELCVDSPLNEPMIVGTAFGASLHEDFWAFPEIQFGDYSLNCLHWFVAAGLWLWTTNGKSVPKMCVRMPVDPFRGGAVYHSMSVDGYFTPIPGLVIAVPTTSYDVYGMLRTAAEYEGPTLILEPKIMYRQLKGPKLPGEPAELAATRVMSGGDTVDSIEDYRVPFGKGVVRREGSDLTIVSWGWAVHQALDAAEELASGADPIDCEVIDLRSLVPYDVELVRQSVAKTGRLLVAHPDRTFGSFGRQVQGDVVEHSPGTPSLVVGMKNVPACTQAVEVEDQIALQTPWIVEAARHVTGVEVLTAAGAAGAAYVRADDPMAWVRWSTSSMTG